MPLGLFSHQPPPAENPWITHFFRDLADKNPDCSQVTDDQLLALISNKWATTVIPYSIDDTDPAWMTDILNDNAVAAYPLRAQPIHLFYREAIERAAAHVFAHYTRITNGRLQFRQQATFHSDTPFWGDVFARGISIMLAGSLDDIKRASNDVASAYMYSRRDNSGYLRQAAIYLPNDFSVWFHEAEHPNDYANSFLLLSHEIGHALGIMDWNNSPAMLNTLQKTPLGLYCSVMPYRHQIDSPISRCQSQSRSCLTPYAIFPGPLDQRWLRLVYEQEAWSPVNDLLSHRAHQTNMLEITMFAFCFMIWHPILISLITRRLKRHPIHAAMMTNLLVLLAMMACDMPLAALMIYSVATISQYLLASASAWQTEVTLPLNQLGVILYAVIWNGLSSTQDSVATALCAFLGIFFAETLTRLAQALSRDEATLKKELNTTYAPLTTVDLDDEITAVKTVSPQKVSASLLTWMSPEPIALLTSTADETRITIPDTTLTSSFKAS